MTNFSRFAIAWRNFNAFDARNFAYVLETKPMDCRIQAPLTTAIDIPLLQNISGDCSTHGDMQLSTLHPEIALNNFRSINARMGGCLSGSDLSSSDHVLVVLFLSCLSGSDH